MITIYDPFIQNFEFNDELKRILGWTEEDASQGNFIEKVYPEPVYRRMVVHQADRRSSWRLHLVYIRGCRKRRYILFQPGKIVFTLT